MHELPTLPRGIRAPPRLSHGIYGETAAAAPCSARAASRRTGRSPPPWRAVDRVAPLVGDQEVDVLAARQVAELDQHRGHVVRAQHPEAGLAGGASCSAAPRRRARRRAASRNRGRRPRVSRSVRSCRMSATSSGAVARRPRRRRRPPCSPGRRAWPNPRRRPAPTRYRRSARAHRCAAEIESAWIEMNRSASAARAMPHPLAEGDEDVLVAASSGPGSGPSLRAVFFSFWAKANTMSFSTMPPAAAAPGIDAAVAGVDARSAGACPSRVVRGRRRAGAARLRRRLGRGACGRPPGRPAVSSIDERGRSVRGSGWISMRETRAGWARSITMRDRPGANRPYRKDAMSPSRRRPVSAGSWKFTSGRSTMTRSGPLHDVGALPSTACDSVTVSGLRASLVDLGGDGDRRAVRRAAAGGEPAPSARAARQTPPGEPSSDERRGRMSVAEGPAAARIRIAPSRLTGHLG